MNILSLDSSSKLSPKRSGTALVLLVLTLNAACLTGCGGSSHSGKLGEVQLDMGEIEGLDVDTDIDLDSLNQSLDDLNQSLDALNDLNPEESNPEESSDIPAGDLTKYSYTDVYTDGNNLTVVPNGDLNGATALFNDKELDGFLDYVDSQVLEAGRTINRDFFYDILSVMLVDKELGSDTGYIEKNMIMALAVANNFHDTDVKIRECYLDANNAADYHLKVNAYGRDDIWTVNFGNKTFYMNDGSTEYTSDMFKDDYLAVWMVAIEEYYGIG